MIKLKTIRRRKSTESDDIEMGNLLIDDCDGNAGDPVPPDKLPDAFVDFKNYLKGQKGELVQKST